jgi:hypothetical protein
LQAIRYIGGSPPYIAHWANNKGEMKMYSLPIQAAARHALRTFICDSKSNQIVLSPYAEKLPPICACKNVSRTARQIFTLPPIEKILAGVNIETVKIYHYPVLGVKCHFLGETETFNVNACYSPSDNLFYIYKDNERLLCVYCAETAKKEKIEFDKLYIKTDDTKVLVWQMKESPKKLRAYRSVILSPKYDEFEQKVFFDYQVAYDVEDLKRHYKENFEEGIEILKIEEYAFEFDPDRFVKMDKNSPTMQIIPSLFERAYENKEGQSDK